MFAVFVSLNVQPDRLERFLEGISTNAASAIRDEPGCVQFDVSVDRDDPYRFHLYELYVDAAAFAEHQKAPHFLEWRKVADATVEPESMTRRTADVRFSHREPNGT